MTPILYIVLVLILFASLIFAVSRRRGKLIKKWAHYNYENDEGRARICICKYSRWGLLYILFTGILIFQFGLFSNKVTFVGGDILSFDPESATYEEVPVGLYWDTDNHINERVLISYGTKEDRYSSFGGPQSITENPKVRKINYSMRYSLGKSQANAVSLYQSTESNTVEKSRWFFTLFDNLSNTQTVVPCPINLESILYEFNERHSRELAKFYNPRDEAQQVEFEKLFRGFVDEQALKFGCEIKSVAFEIP